VSEPEIVQLPNGQFVQNCWLVADPRTREAVMIDPGEEPAMFLAELDTRRWTLRAIWLTHAHIDHILGVAAVKRATGVPVFLHPADALHGDAGLFTRGDVALFISKSGASDELLALTPYLDRLAIPLVSIVIQPGWRISKEYGIFATPVAYLVDEQGTLARDVAQGREQILALAEQALATRRRYSVTNQP